jgi:hypothetical protein
MTLNQFAKVQFEKGALLGKLILFCILVSYIINNNPKKKQKERKKTRVKTRFYSNNSS